MERSITFEARVVGGQKERNQRLEVGSAIEGYAEHCDCGMTLVGDERIS